MDAQESDIILVELLMLTTTRKATTATPTTIFQFSLSPSQHLFLQCLGLSKMDWKESV